MAVNGALAGRSIPPVARGRSRSDPAAAVRGAWLLSQPQPTAPKARVAVVQASESRRSEGVEVVCISRLEDYLGWTRRAIREGAELVVWPESAAEDDVVHDPRARARVEELLGGTKAYLLAGSFVLHSPSGLLENAAVMFPPGGAEVSQYAKVLIVPFGEYIPLRPLFGWMEQMGVLPEDRHAGSRWDPLPWARGTVGVSICFESAFGYVSRGLANRGASLLTFLTSDGWVGRTAVAYQHAAFAPLRAVENRRAIARAAATGVSQLLDPYGRPIRSVPLFEKGTAIAELPLRTDRTLYSWLGDWPVGLSWAILALAAAFTRARKRLS
jgi:apolipoprotein N-acyltransferase